jgi:hypothetical protein
MAYSLKHSNTTTVASFDSSDLTGCDCCVSLHYNVMTITPHATVQVYTQIS